MRMKKQIQHSTQTWELVVYLQLLRNMLCVASCSSSYLFDRCREVSVYVTSSPFRKKHMIQFTGLYWIMVCQLNSHN